MTSSIYDTTVDVNYPIAFTRKVFGGSLTAIYNRSSDGGAVAYLNLTDLRKCNVTISVESDDGGLDSPVIVNCYCNFAKCLKDNKDLELHLKSLSNYRGKDSQYIRIEYMKDLSTLVVTF